MQKLLFIYMLAFLAACSNNSQTTQKNWQTYQNLQRSIHLSEKMIEQHYTTIERWRAHNINRMLYPLTVDIKQRQDSLQDQFTQAYQHLAKDTSYHQALGDTKPVEDWLKSGATDRFIAQILEQTAATKTLVDSFWTSTSKWSGLSRQEVDIKHKSLHAAYDDFFTLNTAWEVQKEEDFFKATDVEGKTVVEALIYLSIWEQQVLSFYDYLIQDIRKMVSRPFHSLDFFGHHIEQTTEADSVHYLGEEVTLAIGIKRAHWEDDYDSIRYSINGQQVLQTIVEDEPYEVELTFELPSKEKGTHEVELYLEAYHYDYGWRDEGRQLINYEIQ